MRDLLLFMIGITWGMTGMVFAAAADLKRPWFGLSAVFWPITIVYMCLAADRTKEIGR